MSEVKELEEQLANAKLLAGKRERLERLIANPDFQELIVKDFSTDECSRYAQASADPMLGPVERADALGIAQAAGHLKRWIAVILQQGYVAARDMEEVEAALAEARAEELAG